ncbi:MAG: asparagine synthase (glutamine-hydrolyzing) [Magnetococcales bacterium]|nr:asparagine synthase (glutamine-hydrolyzing) [Magnetococcales bacterium]
MCGITGLVSTHGADFDRFSGMTDALAHRGPDARGEFRAPGIALGHRRLSIIDLSEAANQPMHNEDGSLILVANGEIYNHRELRESLGRKGHRFRSGSDCEVLLHRYEELGEDLLEGVNGMFAFALWDRNRNRLLVAVDRFGKKPLYYAALGARFALASEMHALLHLPWVEKSLDPVALDRYLTFRHVPAPLTMLQAVRKLEPATLLVWESGRIATRRYWRPRPAITPETVYDATVVDRFEALFDDAVALRLQSDVPLGLYLSGGVDSAAVASSMARQQTTGDRISYTIGFDYRHNEHPRAQRVAAHLGFDFNPVEVEPELFGSTAKIAFHLDEPFGDMLCLPAYCLAREARKRLTVVLTGDGADEILNGYFHQRLMMLRERNLWLFAASGAGRALAALARAVPAAVVDRFFDYPDRFGPREKLKLVQALTHSGAFGGFYEGITSCFSPEDKQSICTPELREQWSGEPLHLFFHRQMEENREFDFNARLSLLDLQCWIPFSVLYRLDKLNMAHAVETRSPFLDYRLVEAALHLPPQAKFNPRRNKEVLRAIIDRHFPEPLREKGKQAFYMPLTSPTRRQFAAWCRALLTREGVARRGLFVWSAVERLFFQFDHGSMLAYRQLAALAMLEQWFRVVMDTNPHRESASS